ncbi:MAG TPA: DNA polymerase [Blastocatellia bacterium]|nr:DNA polymerase [Blastocatellia bacterium]
MNKKDYKLIKQPGELAQAVEVLRRAEFIGFDTETTGLDPHTSKLRLMQFAASSGGEAGEQAAYVIDCFSLTREQLRPVLELLAAARPVKVAHNAKFDVEFVMRHYGVRLGAVYDTMLASQLISAGNEDDRHSLEAAARRYLGWQLDKGAQMSDWSGDLTEYQLEYAALDAIAVLALREKLVPLLAEMGLERAAQLEFDCVMAIAAMELAGIYLDASCWRAQVGHVKAAHEKVAAELQKQLGSGAPQMSLFESGAQINLDSPAQVREALARMGIKVDDTRERRLQRLAHQYPVIELLLEYRHLSKSLGSYGEGMLDYINQVTGRIHANFRQIGTPTGRMTCSSPSLQQVPHAVEYRSCFRAPRGRKLVVADYSQIELRILADFAGDEALQQAFTSGADLHRATASQMLGIPLEEVTAQQREYAKRLNYGIIYGMGADGLAGMLEIPVEEAGRLIDRYFAAYAGVARWLRDASEAAVREGRSRTASGRLWVYRFDVNDHQQLGALKRVGRNTPIQGTSSDILKRAIRLTDDALMNRDAQIINSIHDELVVECDEASAGETARIVSGTMVAAGKEFISRVPVVVEAVISDAWVKK